MGSNGHSRVTGNPELTSASVPLVLANVLLVTKQPPLEAHGAQSHNPSEEQLDIRSLRGGRLPIDRECNRCHQSRAERTQVGFVYGEAHFAPGSRGVGLQVRDQQPADHERDAVLLHSAGKSDLLEILKRSNRGSLVLLSAGVAAQALP